MPSIRPYSLSTISYSLPLSPNIPCRTVRHIPPRRYRGRADCSKRRNG
jgi:hypothetical protein